MKLKHAILSVMGREVWMVNVTSRDDTRASQIVN